LKNLNDKLKSIMVVARGKGKGGKGYGKVGAKRHKAK
jgi:hypothetical protein